MNILRSKLTQSTKEIKNNPNLRNKIDTIGSQYMSSNDKKMKENSPRMKMDYQSNNYFYNEEGYFNEYPYKRFEYYNTNDNKQKYNIESNSSHITVENEDSVIKYFPNNKNYNYNYTKYNYIPTQKNNNYIEISSHKNIDYYDDDNDNSDYSDNNENDNIYSLNESENKYENRNRLYKSQRLKYNPYQENINYYLPKKKLIKKKNQNIISKGLPNNINYSSEKNMKMKVKKKLHNCGNNTTTTNNTYNNNIYYINPINVKNKNKTKEKNNSMNANKTKKNNNTKKNFIYKSVDITLQKKRNYKEKDYFKINNIDKSKKEIYIKAVILIQSVLRGYLVKIKLYNNVNLYVCCKRGIDILQEILLNWKNVFWKIFHNNVLMKSPSFSIRAKYKLKNSKNKEPIINNLYKETRDSFNIINRNIKRDYREKKLKSKLNEIMRENNELKNRLIDNKNIQIKLQSLRNENKKNQNINAIIMKDNMQLAKKLKDIQNYKTHRLFIENQYSIDLNQLESIPTQEIHNFNEIYISKLKIIILRKNIYKKMTIENNIIKEKFKVYRSIVQKRKNNEQENNIRKMMHFNNIFNIIDRNMKIIKDKYFWKLYHYGIDLEKEYIERENYINEKLKKFIKNKEEKNKFFLTKIFFKFLINKITLENEEEKLISEKEEEKAKEIKRGQLMKKLYNKYENNVRLIYKVVFEKWNLKSKIIGMRTAARDKKKKRKQKKKNLKLMYNNKNYNLGENNNNYRPNFFKSIHELNYLISNQKHINKKESGKVLLGNKSTSNINNKINTLSNYIEDKEINKKKTKSVNKRNSMKDKKASNIKEKDNKNNNKESDEDSGDSFGLDNNSDCQ